MAHESSEQSGVRAVCFDVGETLVDETRQWGAWADWLGVPRLTFFGALGGIIERGEHHSAVFELLRPGLDVEGERAAMAAAGRSDAFDAADLYPDVAPCLRALKEEGYIVGLVGNHTRRAEEALRAMRLPVDIVASSEGWGVEKPSPAFFDRVAEAVGIPPAGIAYVGDRLDNDVLPALGAGMVAVFLRRGPWGVLHAGRPEAARATIRLDSLLALPAALRTVGAR